MVALQNSKGSYYFNNFYIVTQARTYQAAGTVVKYSGASSSPEQIVAKGPLDDQLLVKVMLHALTILVDFFVLPFVIQLVFVGAELES